MQAPAEPNVSVDSQAAERRDERHLNTGREVCLQLPLASDGQLYIQLFHYFPDFFKRTGRVERLETQGKEKVP